MSPPKKTAPSTEQRWKCSGFETDAPDAKGVTAMHFTLNSEDGFTFVVSVSGHMSCEPKHFIDALRVAVARIAMAAGGVFEGARAVPNTKGH